MTIFAIIVALVAGLLIGFGVGFRLGLSKAPQAEALAPGEPVQRIRNASDHLARFTRAAEQATDPKRKAELEKHRDYYARLAQLEQERP